MPGRRWCVYGLGPAMAGAGAILAALARAGPAPEGGRPVPPPALTGPASRVAAARSPDAADGARELATAVAPGTQRMAERLAQINARIDPLANSFANSERVEEIARVLNWAKDGARRDQMRGSLAVELLFSGRTGAARTVVEQLRQKGDELAGAMLMPYPGLHAFLGMSYLFDAQQETCGAAQGMEGCLIPRIGNAGAPAAGTAAAAAAAEFGTMAANQPRNLVVRWLLNVAHMTAGSYPGGVPAALLVPPSAFASDAPFPRFPDVAAAAGLRITARAGGSVLDDLDGDGDLDVLASSWGVRDRMRLFRNDGTGTFTEATERSGLLGEVGGLNLAPADYDNDGDVDVFVLRGAWLGAAGEFPNSLLRNRGDGWFEDVTEEAGMLTFHPTQVGVWADYDNDGWLDLFVGNETDPSRPHRSELWHNNRDGTFTDRARDLGDSDFGFVKGAAWGDYNNDGRVDLYVSVQGGDNLLLRNDGPAPGAGPDAAGWKFTNVAREAGVTEPRFSFPAWFWDYDNDGWLDLFVAGYAPADVGDVAALYLGLPSRAGLPRLYRNRRDGTFEDATRAARLDRVTFVMGANFGDVDNDGWLDCYLGTGAPGLEVVMPNRVFRNERGKVFQDVTTAGGFGHMGKGHGVSFGDVDNDGDQDIFVEMGGAFRGDVSRSVLHENPGFSNHWLTLRLTGRRSNRSGVGARIRVRVTSPHGPREIHATAGSGGSFGASSFQQEIGLGDAVAIEALEVRWPASGLVQVFPSVKMDRTYRVVEGQASLEPVMTRSFRLAGGGGARQAAR